MYIATLEQASRMVCLSIHFILAIIAVYNSIHRNVYSIHTTQRYSTALCVVAPMCILSVIVGVCVWVCVGVCVFEVMAKCDS